MEASPYKIIPLPQLDLKDIRPQQFLSSYADCGLFLCTGGHIELSIEQQPFTLQRGSAFFYYPAVWVQLLKADADVKGVFIVSSVHYTYPIIRKVFNTDNFIYMREHPCIRLAEADIKWIEEVVASLQERFRISAENNFSPLQQQIYHEETDAYCQAIIYRLLNCYLAQQPVYLPTSNKKDHIFQQFMDALYKNFQRIREVADYAEMQHLTPRYFSSVIKAQSGLSASQWIINLVIADAQKKLVDTNMSIKEIAASLNFPNQSFFGRYFKQYVGASPATFRKAHSS